MKYINTFKTHASYEEKLNVGGVDISLPNVSYCEDGEDVHYTPYNLVRFYVGEITPPQTVKIYTDKSTSVDIQVSEGNKWYTYLLPKDKGLFKIEGDSVKKVVVKANITTNGNRIIPKTIIEASFKGSNTSKVTNMASMFDDCSGLISLDLSGWNTSKVTLMPSMFYKCSGLTSLDVSSFDTSNVTNMGSMFYNCSGLKSLDLRNFNTSKVDSMSGMFQGSNGLTSLDLSGWDTSNVTSMFGMFSYCSNLAELDLSGWNMSKVNSIGWMFDGCSKLKTIRMVGCSGATITKIQNQLREDNITGVTIVTE